jgi:ApbE superfamily uncharacterized protein (UPF0280 family)
VQDVTLRITGREDLYEEARAAGMHFWEQVQSYAIRNPLFRTTRRRLFVPDDAPEPVRDMAEQAALAGVGPMYTFQGALAEYVGRHLSPASDEIMVANGGHYFVIAKKRARLRIHSDPDDTDHGLAVVVRPDLGPHGIYTDVGRRRAGPAGDGLVVLARSAILADAAAVAGRAILSKSGSIPDTLAFFSGVEGVHGAMVIRGADIGLAGGLELAA